MAAAAAVGGGADASPTLFEDIFEVHGVNVAGKRFERVSRLSCRAERFEIDLELDVNTDIYKVKAGEKITLMLARTLNLDGTPTDSYDLSEKKTLADEYEYVMHGAVFRIDGKTSKDANVAVYASFGGLQMGLKGDRRQLTHFEVDQKLFLLLR
jgi:DNA-directed RNA polymerase I, II, and III subunit RPABC3